MVSSLSPYNLHFLFACVLSILALICIVLIVVFCDAIRRDSVFLLKFPFLSYVKDFSCEMLFISCLTRSFLFPSYCHSVGHRFVSIVLIAVISPLSHFSM